MQNDYKSPAFRKLLDSLQQQSWELELIISGFAIFGLFTAYEPLYIAAGTAEGEGNIAEFVINVVAWLACCILLINLLLHVILRGVWIGALGLRYVSGDIDFEVLKYGTKFKSYLKKRIVSFDRYIANLENYCSVLFALSFLTIFFVVGFTLIILSISLVANYLIDSETLPQWLAKGLGIPLIIFLVVGMLLTFIDFLTLGLLKRNKWVARLYFPFYWVFSFLSLSFLYRPLLYNFLDQKFGKRLILMLTPIYISILIITGLEYRKSNYFHVDLNSRAFMANRENYQDQLTQKGDLPAQINIPSKVITTPYLQVVISFSNAIEDRIFKYNPDLKPKKDRRHLFSTNFNFNVEDWYSKLKNKDSIRNQYIKTFNDIYSIKIDSVVVPSAFIMATNTKDQLIFETYVPLKNITDGKHILHLMRKEKKDTALITTTRTNLPFWYFKP